MQEIKKEIINFSRLIGFDLIGFAKADPFINEYNFLKERKERGLISPFEETDLEKRCFPEKVMKDAKTIIVFALNYLNHFNSTIRFTKEYIGGKKNEGIFSKYACIVDYHIIIKDKLFKVANFIKDRFNADSKIFVDSGAILERAAAQRAGLGYIGANTCLFTKEYGSYVFLGEIITNIELPEDAPVESLCNGCGKCIFACPTGALYEPFKLNPFKCLSYLTQSKTAITDKMMIKAFANRLFGCDTCQDVCPNNQLNNILIKNHREFFLDYKLPVDPFYILKMGKKEYKEHFGTTPVEWRGKNILRRNALIAISNSGELDKLNKDVILKDSSEIVREQAKVLLI